MVFFRLKGKISVELVDSLNQIFLLYGFDRRGVQTIIAVCLESDDLEEALKMIWDEWPTTEMIRRYPLPIVGGKEQVCYIRDDKGHIRKF